MVRCFYVYLAHLEMIHYRVSVKDFRLECFCFLLPCIFKIIHLCSVITLPVNSDGFLCRNLCWSFLNASIISLLNWWVFQFVSVFVGKVPLGLICTCLFNSCVAYCINNSGSVI